MRNASSGATSYQPGNQPGLACKRKFCNLFKWESSICVLSLASSLIGNFGLISNVNKWQPCKFHSSNQARMFIIEIIRPDTEIMAPKLLKQTPEILLSNIPIFLHKPHLFCSYEEALRAGRLIHCRLGKLSSCNQRTVLYMFWC